MAALADNPAVNEVVVSEAVATFSDGKSTDFFVVVVDPVTRELITMQFYEKRRDLGEIRLLKQVKWDFIVPQDARLFMPTSGLPADQLNMFWVGWKFPDKLSALSMYQEFPIDVPLDPGTRLINPPIILPSMKMVQYVWLPKDTAWLLYQYEFHGNHGERGTVTRERIRQEDHEPILSAATAISGAEDDRAAVAWIESTDTGIKVLANLMAGNSSDALETLPIPYITPLLGQRLAMDANQEGETTVGFVAESRIGGYLVMEVRFDFKKHLYTVHTQSLHIVPGTLQSACMFYFKGTHDPANFVCAMTKEGTLKVISPGSDSVQSARERVDQDYDFPIVTSATGRYEATRSGGQIELSNFP